MHAQGGFLHGLERKLTHMNAGRLCRAIEFIGELFSWHFNCCGGGGGGVGKQGAPHTHRERVTIFFRFLCASQCRSEQK